jgi:transposase
MSSQLTLQQFQRAADRFLNAKAKVLETWTTPCQCDVPGAFVKCEDCPYFKGYVLRLQEQLDVAPGIRLPAVLAPALKAPYSKEVRQQCLELFRLGFSIGGIQQLTGVANRKTLRRWLYSEGLLQRADQLTSTIRQQCLDLYSDGLTVKEIEDLMRIGGDIISSLVSDESLSRPKPNYSQQQRQASLELYMQGLSLQEIEEKTQVHGPTIRSWAKAEGLHRERRYGGGRTRVYDQAFREDCLRLLEEGWTLPQVELEKGVAIDTIRRWKKEAEQNAAPDVD